MTASRRDMARFSLLLILPSWLFSTVKSDCYFPNGTNRDDGTGVWSSCNRDFDVSMCCSINQKCLPDGLCQSGDQPIWRESCTDPFWRSENCTKLCTDGLVQGTGRCDILIQELNNVLIVTVFKQPLTGHRGPIMM